MARKINFNITKYGGKKEQKQFLLFTYLTLIAWNKKSLANRALAIPNTKQSLDFEINLN